jgi:iron complex outermembrane receptor protein
MYNKASKTACCVGLVLGVAQVGVQASETLPSSSVGEVLVREAAPEFRQFDKVEITGSALRRPAESRALPVEIITREDIRKSGLRSTTELIQRLPYMGNMMEAGQYLASNGGFSNAAIHGMPNGTLVLVNGSRMAPYGLQNIAGSERTGVDLDTLPISAIDRVEILTDGASSLYGTDALAGVVNIIMSDERQGLSISADKTVPHGGAASTEQFALQAAHGKLQRDGYHLRLELEHSERGNLAGQDRPSLSQGYIPVTINGQTENLTYALTGFYAGTATLYDPAQNRYWNSAWSPALAQGQSCPSGWVDESRYGACLNNPYSGMDLYPSQRRTTLHARGEVQTDAGQTLFADVLWGRNTQQMRSYFAGTLRAVDSSDPVAGPWLQQAGMSSAYVLWRPAIAGPILASDSTTWRTEVGLKGQWQQWDYQATASYTVSQSDWRYTRQLPPGLLGQQGTMPLSDGWFNPASQPQLNAELEGLITSYPVDSGQTSILGAQGRVQREFGLLGGGPIQWAFGSDIRRETSRYINFNQETPQPDFKLHRHDAAVYTELRTPWRPGFETTASVRADRYDQFNTVNAKLSGLWCPAQGWMLRSAVGTGFRAPQTAQLNEQRYLQNYAQTPSSYTCPTSLANALGANCGLNSARIAAYTQGSADLQPETSEQITLGIRREFNHRISLSADAWQVSMRNEIGQAQSIAVLQNPLANPDNFIREPNGDLALYLPLRNLSSSLKRGIDFDLRWRQPTDHGRITLQALVTRYLASWKDDGTGQQSDLGRISTLTYKPTPKYSAQLMLAYNTADWNVGAILRYRSAYTDLQITNLPTFTISAFTTLDLVGQWNFGKQVELRGGLYNVANRLPAQGINSPAVNLPGIDTAYSNLWGRTLRIGATYRF